MEVELQDFPFVSFVVAGLLAAHGFRKKSLSPSGAAAAFVVGFLTMATRERAFGVSLLVFYFVGSRATKVGKTLKASLEEGHQEAGYRTAWQVLCNSCTAVVAALVWSGLFVKGSYVSSLLPRSLVLQGGLYAPDTWCSLSATHGQGWSRWLLYASLGHFACCLGDTLASELGILSKSPPLLVTKFTRVPPGTNGGISLLGTAASVMGGFIMGLTMSLTLILESTACRRTWISLLTELSVRGAFSGALGSLIDSLMGATIQRTRYSMASKRILQDDTVAAVNDEDVKVVSGLNLLTNNQVNLISSTLTALIIATLS